MLHKQQKQQKLNIIYEARGKRIWIKQQMHAIPDIEAIAKTKKNNSNILINIMKIHHAEQKNIGNLVVERMFLRTYAWQSRDYH